MIRIFAAANTLLPTQRAINPGFNVISGEVLRYFLGPSSDPSQQQHSTKQQQQEKKVPPSAKFKITLVSPC